MVQTRTAGGLPGSVANTVRFSICDRTDIHCVVVKKSQILSEICGFSIATQRILVGSHIWYWEVKERLELHSLCTDHVAIQSALKYLIGGKVVMLKYRIFGSKTGRFPMRPVFRVVRPIATVPFGVQLEPELTREFGPVANRTPPAVGFGIGSIFVASRSKTSHFSLKFPLISQQF